jgi:hypothetical protein
MQADSGCGYFKEKSTGFPQIPQTVCVAYIFFLLMRNCCWCEPFRSGLGTGIVYLRATQKAPHRSASCENNLRSFVNGGADLSGGSLSTCIHRPKPESLAAVQILCVGFYGQPTDRMEQNVSSCTHVLHKPLTGLKKIGGDFNESTSLRYIYTFLSLNYNIGKTNRANKFKHFAKIF